MTGVGVVYFLRRADGEGPIKIGSTRDLTKRFSGLQHWVPYPLAILATMRGNVATERRFHAAFAAQHSHCEWFHPSPELLRVIAAVVAGTFDVADLPMPARITHPTGPWSKDRKRCGKLRARLRQFRNDHGYQAVPQPVWDAAKSLTIMDEAARADAAAVVGHFLSIHGAWGSESREAA